MPSEIPLLAMRSFLSPLRAAVFVAGMISVHAQTVPEIEWQRSFGGSSSDLCQIVKQTSDGGYILGGTSSSDVSGNKTSMHYGGDDYWVIKIDGNGNKLWENSFGGSDTDSLQSLEPTSDGGYILGGVSHSPVSGNKTSVSFGRGDYWVVKIDADGNKVWEQSFGGSDNDRLESLQQTSDGGYILGGSSYSGVSGNKTAVVLGNRDFWVVKIDGDGEKVWESSFGGAEDDSLFSLQQTSDGGYILGGTLYSGLERFGDFWVIKIDEAGNEVWENAFGGADIEVFHSVQTDPRRRISSRWHFLLWGFGEQKQRPIWVPRLLVD
jgi:hypothetical protein